ncbi:C-type lectin domain family 6 member A-like [Patiria miniata]|uniref:C-type lectin domain-containing protein n=1 Tax=Patiria miniata TaxID=46514 RepID=A0A913ZL82_PATMI|nr:C-type lectin domain family 6 member A-like [Patiria miniata]
MHSSVFVVFATSCFVVQVAARCRSLAPGCPAPWRQWGNSCYSLTESLVKWDKARDACGNMGGVLAVPRSLQENDFIQTFIAASLNVWIDCNDITTEGRWECQENGVEVNFRKWDQDQPETGMTGDGEDCAVIRSASSGHQGWHDYPCDDNFKAVCKKLF